MNTFIGFYQIYFLCHIGDIDLPEEIKMPIEQILEKLPIEAGVLYDMAIVTLVLNLLFSTHQYYWQTLLDSSWCNNNWYNRQKAGANDDVID